MTGFPAIDAVIAGFAKVEAVLEASVPLMIGVAAVVVAAEWGMRMLNGGGGSDDYDSNGNFYGDMKD